MKPDLFTRLYLWLMNHRRAVLLATLAVTVTAFLIALRIDLEEDVLAALPQNDQRVDEYKYTLRKFRQIDRLYFDVSVKTDDPEKLAAAVHAVHDRLQTNSTYLRVMEPLEGGGQQKIVDFLTGALPNLFTEADAAALATKLEPAEVREYLTTIRRKLAGPEGMVLKDVVAADPIGMSALVVAKVLPLQTGFGDAQIVDGRITSGDGRHVLLVAEPIFTSSNARASEALVGDLVQMVRDVERQFPGVQVAFTGGHRMAVDNATFIKADATRCIFLGMVSMGALCFAAFRRRWLAFVAFLPSFVGTLIAGVVLALWHKHLSAIAMGFATIAIGITVDYAIHVIYHLDDAAGMNRVGVGRHLGRLVLPISLGSLTTVAAFWVMTTSPLRGYQQLGIYGVIGVLCSAAFALLILPLLVPIPKTTGQPPLWLTRLMEKFHTWRGRRLIWLLPVLVVMSVLAAVGLHSLRFEGDLARLNGITESTRQDEALIRKTWGDALGLTLVVARAPTVEAALAQNDFVADTLARQTNVKSFYSLAAVCPAPATQEANIQRWREFWSSARLASLQQTLQPLAAELGFRGEAFAKFWARVEGTPALLTLDLFRGTPLEQALHERVALATNDHAISTLLQLEDRTRVEQLRATLPGIIVIDQKDFGDHIALLTKSGLGHFALWSGILVAVILYLTLGSIELLIAIMLPLAFGLLWTFGLMGWLGLPIDMMNSIFVIFIIGIGEDYAVFIAMSKLDEWRGRPQRLAATSATVLISALTTIFGFAVLAFAKHPMLFSMGTIVLIGMMFTFLATIILTPLCMDLLLFKTPPTGALRWWHLLGTVQAAVHLALLQSFVYFVQRPILHLFRARNIQARLAAMIAYLSRGMFHALPYGRIRFKNFSRATFTPPCIVISNHQSAMDVMVFVAWAETVRQTAKKRVFDEPYLGLGCKILGHVMVEPSQPAQTLQRCRDRLAAGASVHFYPEGTRSRDGWVQRFHRGAFELAIELNQEILPVVLCDTITCVPRDAFWIEPGHAVIVALPRVTPQNFDYSQGVVPLMKHCEALVREGLQQQLDELNTPPVVRRKINRLYRYQGKFVEQFVAWKLRLDPVYPALDAVVPRRAHVLDLGCGYGVATHWLATFTDTRTFWGVDYDEDKIRAAQCSAAGHPRIQFTSGDLLTCEYPAGDVALLLDVLHYWTPAKQQVILTKARQALRPGGRLVLRDAARADHAAYQKVQRWEKFATRVGMNQTQEGLHFQTQPELEAMLQRAGFARWEIKAGAGNDSNVMLVAYV
jgi:1-acyl-sn-glycerol-3-phosphate acyltransferase